MVDEKMSAVASTASATSAYVRVADQPGDQLRDRQAGVHEDGDLCGAHSPLARVSHVDALLAARSATGVRPPSRGPASPPASTHTPDGLPLPMANGLTRAVRAVRGRRAAGSPDDLHASGVGTIRCHRLVHEPSDVRPPGRCLVTVERWPLRSERHMEPGKDILPRGLTLRPDRRAHAGHHGEWIECGRSHRARRSRAGTRGRSPVRPTRSLRRSPTPRSELAGEASQTPWTDLPRRRNFCSLSPMRRHRPSVG